MSSYFGDRSQAVPSWDVLDVDDDQDIVDTSEYAYASRDHVLFCIDASRSMQTPRPDSANPAGIVRGKSALHQVLDAVVDLQKKKVITGPSDSVGIVLWNIDPGKATSSTSGNYKPGTMVYQPLRTINAEEMKKVIKLLEAAQSEYEAQATDDSFTTAQPTTLTQAFPPCPEGEELNVADVLVTCNFLFRDAKLPGNKRVFMITDNDNPPGSSSNREPARTVYSDLLTYGITINTFFIDKSDHRFNPTLYWNDILGRDEDEDAPEDSEPEGLDKLADLLTDLAIRNAPKRMQFSIPLRLGGKDGEIEIGVAGYALVSAQNKGQPKYVRMRGQTVEEVITKTEYTSTETGAVLRDEEIGHAFQFGNEATIQNVLETNWWESRDFQEEQRQVADEMIKLEQDRRRREDEGEEPKEIKEPKVEMVNTDRVIARTRLQFTPDEVAQFKSMGLSPRTNAKDSVVDDAEIKILGFQSPDDLNLEDNIKHSYFLYPDEEEKHALALCRFKRNIMPEFAVLIPQEETFTEGGGQDMPPGFHVIVLPYCDDIRAPPKQMKENLTASERQAKLMSNIVKRLRNKAGKYRSEVYPNPALQYHYAQLQALAFEEDFDLSQRIDEIDKTYPKYQGMHRAAGDFMAEFNKAIEEDERAEDAPVRATKRSAVAELDESDLADVKGAWEEGTLHSLKVQDLKNFAKYHAISLEGKTKKADLIEIIGKWLSHEGSGKKAKM